MRIQLVVIAVIVMGVGSRPAQAQDIRDLSSLSATLETLGERVGPAVVQVFTIGYVVGQGVVPSSSSLLLPQRGAGSGVLLDPTGYIVTNAHVIEGATRIQVRLPTTPGDGVSVLSPRGELVAAQVIGIDLETDLAVLKVESKRELPFLELGDSEALRPGQLVMAFGSPLGLGNSVSLGVVSAPARQVRPDDPMIYIQTDASINPGNSGGPLVDVSGRVVGISSFILSQGGGSDGIGFAAPSNIVANVYLQIREFGRVRRGELGVRAQTITPELAARLGLARDRGVVLADVYPLGPADTAGIRIGDIVLALDGKAMENARQFQINVYPKGAGDDVAVEVLRHDTRLTFDVSPVERRSDPDRFRHMVRPEDHLVRRLGILGLNLTPDLAAMFPPLRIQQGVVVAASSLTATGFESGPLRPGDLIHRVNQRPIGGLTALRASLDELPSGAVVVLQVERGGQLHYLTIAVE